MHISKVMEYLKPVLKLANKAVLNKNEREDKL